MKGKWRLTALVLMAFFVTFLAVPHAMAVKKGGTLIYGQQASPQKLDPPVTEDNAGEEVNRMLYENLVRFSPEMKLEPALATSWENSPDGLTWTFHLRKGVKFHDGTHFNADAVVYYFNRSTGPEKPLKGYGLFGTLVKSAETVDEYTVKVQLNEPFSFFLNRIAHSGAGIGSPTAHKKLGKDLAFNPVGTGPFKLAEWVKGDHITLVANEDYWGGRPNLDKVIVKPVTEEGARILQLETGQLDVTTGIPPEALPRLRKNEKLSVVLKQSNIGVRLVMNNTKKPFDNILVRRAVNYAIDKEAIAKHLYTGLAVPIPGVVSPVITGYEPMRFYKYDPERAKALLAKAGYPDGFTANMWTFSGRIMKDLELSQTIQKYLAAVGIKAKLQVMEWGTFLSKTRVAKEKNESEMFLMKWAPSTAEASWVLWPAFTKANWPPTGSTRSFYHNPAFDKLVDLSMTSSDVKLRDAYLRAAQIVLAEDAAVAFLISPKIIMAQSKKVHGIVFSPLALIYATEKTWVDK